MNVKQQESRKSCWFNVYLATQLFYGTIGSHRFLQVQSIQKSSKKYKLKEAIGLKNLQ